ncbi:hypothetical protein [Pedobacter sp. ASV28]|jgi:hypothetical protein|uniref:hypothetical protein n=1 Tax=Pedobacter sp. ASV28 TaxID=2795123 RepID=UPI0018EB04BD|nr:hypothetical protein [Pedobacter sp. ASV28]
MQDFIINDDLDIENGDLLIGYADEYHQRNILIAEKGEYKEYPELGVGIMNMLNSEDAAGMLLEAKRNFEYDLMRVKELRFTDDNRLKIEAEY